MCVDYLENFGGWKWFREHTNGAESLRFVANLRTDVRGDEKNRYLRVKCEKFRDYLESCDVRQEKIDNTELKTPVTSLFDSLLPCCYKHNLVAARLKHKPERVAYRRLVINHQDG